MADGPDYGRLKSQLAASKLQTSNNPAWQTIVLLIEGLQRFQEFVQGRFQDTSFARKIASDIQDAIDGVVQVVFIEPDTSGTGQNVIIGQYEGDAYVVKDVAGNAATNNITLVGTIDGVVDPVINTDYGVFRFYKGAGGLYYEW